MAGPKGRSGKTETLGGRIKRARLALGLTQEELREALGLRDVGTVSRWERDEDRPSALAWEKLPHILRLSREELENGPAGAAGVVRESAAPYQVGEEPGPEPGWFESQLPDDELIEMVVHDRRGFHRYMALHEFANPRLTAAAKLARLDWLERKARQAGKAFPTDFFEHFRGLVRDRAL